MIDILAQNPTAVYIIAGFLISLIVALILANVIRDGKLTDERNRIEREYQAEQDKYNEFIKNHKY